jgi:uncharacterized protein (TIGR02145 family)
MKKALLLTGMLCLTLIVLLNSCQEEESAKSGPPEAAFTGSPLSGIVPLSVQFTDQSTFVPTNWNWDFGDGNTSTLQNPSHVYSRTGSYDVTLAVSNDHGSDIHTEPQFITVSHETGIFTDSRDNQTYQWVKIGNQVWMAENLNFIVHLSWCYNDNETNCNSYGRLYTWPAAMAGALSSEANPSGIQGVCPPGWHLPSDAEWADLLGYVAAQGYPNQPAPDNPNGTANALKSCRQMGSPLGDGCNTPNHPRWDSHSVHSGFDAFGFSALPGGYRNNHGGFFGLGANGYWWTATERSSLTSWVRFMSHNSPSVIQGYTDKGYGYSIRCVRDD